MAQNELIRIESLSVNYDGKVALEKIHLSVYDGEFTAIVGPNGGGKSTLVKAILGLVPYTGTISYAPEVANKASIGYMPQVNNFDRAFPISVGELILSGLQGDKKHSWGHYGADDRAKVARVARQLGVEGLVNKAIGELSGGELQRALLGRAIISEPRMLILDEPANFVDPKFESELYELLVELNKRIAIVMVSHNEAAVRNLAHRVVCINRTIQPSPAY